MVDEWVFLGPGSVDTGVMVKKTLQVCALFLLALLAACDRRPPVKEGRKTLVATCSVLGSVVKELAGEDFEVRTLIPNGLDIHEWEPSAKDIEALNKADLIVENGLGLEGGLGKALEQARRNGVRVFTAGAHIQVRTTGTDEAVASGHSDHAAGSPDPHLWTDPMAVKAVAGALTEELRQRFGKDLGARNADFGRRLDALDREIRQQVEALPADRRKLVTGHESLGYFAQRYGFTCVGAVVPSLTSEGASSAASMASLKGLIRANGIRTIFTEMGTSPRVVEALGRECRVRVVPLSAHTLPADGSYLTFERGLARAILQGLR